MTGQEKERKWRISDIGRAIVNSLVAIAKGQFILRLKVDKYFLQVVWTFFLFAMFILFGLGVDVTLSKQKRYELVSLSRRSTVGRLLKENGSRVAEPQKPAATLQE